MRAQLYLASSCMHSDAATICGHNLHVCMWSTIAVHAWIRARRGAARCWRAGGARRAASAAAADTAARQKRGHKCVALEGCGHSSLC